MPIAILDFGTNTFNLLVAERKDHGFETLYAGKEPVKLGKNGIQNKRLTPEAIERGYTAIDNHLETIRSLGATEIRAFATSAIRNAGNGPAFAESVTEKYGFPVEIVPGNREADYIYHGVKQAVELSGTPSLILDIGGGSNEFILCDRDRVLWKHSFEIGMARILEHFPISDPVTVWERHLLESYFTKELTRLFNECERHRPKTLIGASGTFDTFRTMREHRRNLPRDGAPGRSIPLEDFNEIHEILLASTLEERKTMPGMEPVRVEMIVPATIFVNLVIRKCGLTGLMQSDYALKEGVLATLLGL